MRVEKMNAVGLEPSMKHEMEIFIPPATKAESLLSVSIVRKLQTWPGERNGLLLFPNGKHIETLVRLRILTARLYSIWTLKSGCKLKEK